MADEGVDMLSAEDQAKLAKLNKKEELAGGLSEEEKAKIAEEAEAAEAVFVQTPVQKRAGPFDQDRQGPASRHRQQQAIGFRHQNDG